MWAALVCLGLIGSVQSQEEMVVQIDQGSLKGFRDGDIFTFFDVPYATVPSGNDKFKAPLPAPKWNETFDAIARNISCPQGDPLPNKQHDCLVANILVPSTGAIHLPVLVFIHGGAYVRGFGHKLQYKSLVTTQKLIVVTFNYRLGVNGFLCLGTEDVPGNAGMKDQVALLRWVNRNIASFGGNPNDVIITGCSAGGSSVDFLTLSPMATGLFHKVISDSGASSLGSLGAQTDPIESAKIYAKILNFTEVDDIVALEEFYKTTSNDILHFDSDKMIDNDYIYFRPCLERDTGMSEEKFITQSPWNILSTGQYIEKPLLYGYTDMEGLMQMVLFDSIKDDMSAHFENYLPKDLQFESDEKKYEVARTVKEFYFGNKNVSEETVLNFVNYYTDMLFAYPILRGLKMRKDARNDTIFLYECSFIDSNTPPVPHTNDVRGANHCMQAAAVADEDTSKATDKYLEFKNTMRELWLSFIFTGNPASQNSSLPEWPSVNHVWSPIMSLSNNSELRNTLVIENRIQLWDGIYEKYYRQPATPAPGSATSLVLSMWLIFVICFSVCSYSATNSL